MLLKNERFTETGGTGIIGIGVAVGVTVGVGVLSGMAVETGVGVVETVTSFDHVQALKPVGLCPRTTTLYTPSLVMEKV